MGQRIEHLGTILFSVILCPEMVALLAMPFMCFVVPRPVAQAIAPLNIPADQLKFLSFIPVVFLGLTAKDFAAVLQPNHSHKDVLLQWPDYWLLKIGYFGSVGYGLWFALVGLSVWFVASPKLTVFMAAALSTSITGSALNYWSIFLAKAKVQEKLAEYGKH